MPIWLVRTTWKEDETEATEQWEVDAPTAEDAVREVTARLGYQPHHVEARQVEEPAGGAPASPARRIVPSQ